MVLHIWQTTDNRLGPTYNGDLGEARISQHLSRILLDTELAFDSSGTALCITQLLLIQEVKPENLLTR